MRHTLIILLLVTLVGCAPNNGPTQPTATPSSAPTSSAKGDSHEGHDHAKGDSHEGHDHAKGDSHEGHDHAKGDSHEGHDHAKGDSHEGHDHANGDSHEGHDHATGDSHEGHDHAKGDSHEGHDHAKGDSHEGHDHAKGDSHEGHDHGSDPHEGHDHAKGDSHEGHDHGSDPHAGHDHPTFTAAPTEEPMQFAKKEKFDYARYLADSNMENMTDMDDLGEVVQGTIRSPQFVIENETDKPIILGPPVSAIGCCFTPELSGTTIAPGQAAILKVTVDTSRQYRELMSNIVLPYKTDDGYKAWLFGVRAYVEPVIEPDPKHVIVDDKGQGEFSVKSKRFESGLKLGKIECQPPELVVTTDSSPKNGQQLFKVDASKVKQKAGAIKIHTNDEKIDYIVVGWNIKKS